jgi:hypothetical protein
MKNSKFNSLFKEAYNRFTQGAGFLAGDVVKLKSGYENMDSFKRLGENVKARIKDMVTSGNNIRISRLHNYTAPSRYSAEGAGNLPADLADCFEESAPGYWHNLITIPVDCLESVDTNGNLPPVPDDQKDMKDRVTGPEDMGEHKMNKGRDIDPQTKLMKKQTKAEKGDYELATKNTKLAHSNKYDDSKPSKVKHLEKTKELKESVLKESENALDSLYISILNEDVGTMGQVNPTASDSGDQLAGNPQIQSEEETAANNDEAKIDAFVNSLPADYNKPFFKDCLTGMKPGMSQEEFQDKLWHNLYAHNLKQYNNDPRRAKTATDNKMWYMDDGDFPMEVGYYYKDVFGHFPGSNKDMEEGNKFTGDLAHTQKGDKFEIGGKTVTNTTGQIAEKICPKCGKELCECDTMEEAKMKMKDESGLQAYLGKKKYGATDFKALQKAGREHDEKKKEQIKNKHKQKAMSEDISFKSSKTYLPGGDVNDPTSAIKASKFSHHGG